MTSYCLMGTDFVWEDKVLEMDVGDGCTTMIIYLMPLNYTFKMVKVTNFMVYIFYHNKKQRKNWGSYK